MAKGFGWDAGIELEKKMALSDGIWMKLADDGAEATLAFIGDPFFREMFWEESRMVEFTPEHEANGDRPSLRMSINVLNKATNKVQIFEQGVTFLRLLKKMKDRYHTAGSKLLGERWFTVQRDGAKGSQKTTYNIFPGDPLTKAELDRAMSMRIYDLEKPEGDNNDSPIPFGGDDDDPKPPVSGGRLINDSVAADIIGRLKEMPESTTESFLNKFGVARIRDISELQQEHAIKAISAIAGPASADPFA
jgi:hypothetical protein